MKTYLLVPTNEGQELNYVEVFKGTRTQAERRAFEIVEGLRPVLRGGTIGCSIQRSPVCERHSHWSRRPKGRTSDLEETPMKKTPIKFTEIQRFAVVGTGHVTEEDSQILTQAGNRSTWNGKVYPVVFDYEYGWFVHIPEPGDLEDNLGEYKKCGLSPAFIRLIRECSEQGIHFLRLDQDGDTIEGLEHFDW